MVTQALQIMHMLGTGQTLPLLQQQFAAGEFGGVLSSIASAVELMDADAGGRLKAIRQSEADGDAALMEALAGEFQRMNAGTAVKVAWFLGAGPAYTIPEVFGGRAGAMKSDLAGGSGVSADALISEGIKPSKINRHICELALRIEGKEIAFGLDGTLVDYVDERVVMGGCVRATISVRQGADALIAGLAKNNRLLLYTNREASQLAEIIGHVPAFRKAFLPGHAIGTKVAEEDILRSQSVFTLQDWLFAMSAVIQKGVEKPEKLTELERKVFGLIMFYKGYPAVLLHLKLPEFAIKTGRHGFDTIVDGSDGLAPLLDSIASNIRRIHLQSRGKQGADDELLQVAQLLHFDGEGFIIQHTNPPEKIPDAELEQFAIESAVSQTAREALDRFNRLIGELIHAERIAGSRMAGAPFRTSGDAQMGQPASARDAHRITDTFQGHPYSRQIAVHPNTSGVILINYPGAGGSIDGFNDKYRKLAEHIARSGLAAVIRIDNPFTLEHYGPLDDGEYEEFLVHGLRTVVRFAKDHTDEICGKKPCRLWLMGFSAGAGAIAASAQALGAEKILLVAPARDAGEDAMLRGLGEFTGDVSITLGVHDPLVPVSFAQNLFQAASKARSRQLEVIPDCDHQFRGRTNGLILSKSPFWAFGNDPSFPSPEGGLVLY